MKVKYTDGTTGGVGSFAKAGEHSYIVYHTDGSKIAESLYLAWEGTGTELVYDKCGIFEGHIELEKFEPYTGGKPSPNPEYPQPIESVGDDGSVDVGCNRHCEDCTILQTATGQN